MFNALKYTEELEKAGFTRNQAEASIKLLIDIMNENFATKSDLFALKSDLESSIFALKSNLESSVQKLDSSIKELEYKMTIKLGAMMTLAIGVTATLMKIIPNLR